MTTAIEWANGVPTGRRRQKGSGTNVKRLRWGVRGWLALGTDRPWLRRIDRGEVTTALPHNLLLMAGSLEASFPNRWCACVSCSKRLTAGRVASVNRLSAPLPPLSAMPSLVEISERVHPCPSCRPEGGDAQTNDIPLS